MIPRNPLYRMWQIRRGGKTEAHITADAPAFGGRSGIRAKLTRKLILRRWLLQPPQAEVRSRGI